MRVVRRYLWVCQAGDVGIEIVDDALGSSRQGDATYQQDGQHQVGECGGKVDHLEQQ